MTEEQLQAFINTFRDAQSVLATASLTFLRDRSNDLNARWILYAQLCRLHVLPTDGWASQIAAFERGNASFSWYDDFYIERYQEVLYPDILEMLEDKDDDDPLKSRRDEFMEEVLQRGSAGFTMDD